MIFVDDLQWLDGASAGLLSQLIDGGYAGWSAPCAAISRVTTAVSSLWRRDNLVRIDLGDLPREDVDTLLHLALGAPVHSAAVAAIWSASSGNPLFIRELVLRPRRPPACGGATASGG